MKRVLILAYYFPPAAASGALRPVGFCAHLAEFGYRAHVLAADPRAIHPPLPLDPTLARILPDSVRVDRIAHRNQLTDLLALRDRMRRLMSRTEATASASGAASERPRSPRPGPLTDVKRLVLDRLFLFPDPQKYWVGPAVRLASRLPADARPDVVLATANPWSSLIAGARIARELRVPFVADFRDPWARNPKPQPSARLVPLAGKLERRVVESASRVIANTRPLREALAGDYPTQARKIVTLSNGYLEAMTPAREEHAPERPGPVELSHFGTVYPLRNPKTLLQALHDLVSSGEVDGQRLRLRFVGGWDVEDAECEGIADALESKACMRRDPGVPRDECMRMMSVASHLLVLQQGFPLQIPAKLYEYVALRRPLVVVGGDGATADLVREHALGVCFPNDRAKLRTALARLASGETAVHPPSQETVRAFGYHSLTGRLARILDEAIETGPPRR